MNERERERERERKIEREGERGFVGLLGESFFFCFGKLKRLGLVFSGFSQLVHWNV
jgi:hypothetical protein